MHRRAMLQRTTNGYRSKKTASWDEAVTISPIIAGDKMLQKKVRVIHHAMDLGCKARRYCYLLLCNKQRAWQMRQR